MLFRSGVELLLEERLHTAVHLGEPLGEFAAADLHLLEAEHTEADGHVSGIAGVGGGGNGAGIGHTCRIVRTANFCKHLGRPAPTSCRLPACRHPVRCHD